MYWIQLSAFVFPGLLERCNDICLFFFLLLFYLLVLLGFAPIGLLWILLSIIFVYLSWDLFQVLTNVQVYSFTWYPIFKPCVHGINYSNFGFLGVFLLYLIWNDWNSIIFLVHPVIIYILIHSYLSSLINKQLTMSSSSHSGLNIHITI